MEDSSSDSGVDMADGNNNNNNKRDLIPIKPLLLIRSYKRKRSTETEPKTEGQKSSSIPVRFFLLNKNGLEMLRQRGPTAFHSLVQGVDFREMTLEPDHPELWMLTIRNRKTSHGQQRDSVKSLSGDCRPTECSISSEHQQARPCLPSVSSVGNSPDEMAPITLSDEGPGMSAEELGPYQKQTISPMELKKLKRRMGTMADVAEVKAEEEESVDEPKPLCRESLSLISSTMEEKDPEGTLHLLSQFLQPGYCPPPEIMMHLLRGLLLDPDCPVPLTVEAYSLLMRVQMYSPTRLHSLMWDWDLICSVMNQQVGPKRLRLEVQSMLLQYVLQVLEDDFNRQLCLRKLHVSIAKNMLSCQQNFAHIRDVISWLCDAVSTFVTCNDETRPIKERMMMVFQKMLVLSLEVDRTPNHTSDKIAQELLHQFITTSPMREQRLLLLNMLESSLLRCKFLVLLLDYHCPLKGQVPTSITLVLHFLQHVNLPADPTDGLATWRRWEELAKLIGMLLLSYDTVMKGHLQLPITERSTCSQEPNWTVHDRVRRGKVLRACDAFLARVERDLGRPPPAEVQGALTLLKARLLD